MPKGVKLEVLEPERHWSIRGRRHVVCVPVRPALRSRVEHAEMSAAEARALASRLWTRASEVDQANAERDAQASA